MVYGGLASRPDSLERPLDRTAMQLRALGTTSHRSVVAARQRCDQLARLQKGKVVSGSGFAITTSIRYTDLVRR